MPQGLSQLCSWLRKVFMQTGCLKLPHKGSLRNGIASSIIAMAKATTKTHNDHHTNYLTIEHSNYNDRNGSSSDCRSGITGPPEQQNRHDADSVTL